MDDLDPSKQRDEEAAATATVRTDEAAATATQRSEHMFANVEKLSAEMLKLKSDLAGNSSLTIAAVQMLDAMKIELGQLGSALTEIQQNTSGLVTLSADVESGAKFLCRLARALRFVLKDVIEPFWKPVGICWVVWFLLTHDKLPDWISPLFKVFG